MKIVVAARASKLSRIQVEELTQALPNVEFEKQFLQSRGDRDLSLCLKEHDKTDLFTDELDAHLLSGGCDVTVHSAKDLPDEIPDGLEIVAITEGIDNSDVLVMQEMATLESLPSGARVATSSKHREDAVSQLRDDFVFAPIRGTIEHRLEQLYHGDFDALVMAEAAIIRLQLLHLNRITLPGETAPLQGKLAILAREGDHRMSALFKPIDWRMCDEANTLFGARPLELSGKP